MNNKDFSQGLKSKTLFSIIVICLLFGAVSSYVAFEISLYRQKQETMLLIAQLSQSTMDTAAAAAYAGDEDLGNKIVNGLAKHELVSGATITSYGIMNIVAGDFDSSMPPVSQELANPVANDKTVGMLKVYPNGNRVEELVYARALSAIIILVCICLLIGIAIFVFINSRLIRPVRELSDAVGNFVTEQKKSLTSLDIEHQRDDEIGYLVTCFNKLIEQLNVQKNCESDLRHQLDDVEKRIRLIFEQASAGIAIIDDNNKLFANNSAFEAVMAFKAEQASNVSDLFLNRHEFDLAINEVRDGERDDQLSVDLPIMRDGELRFIHCLFANISDQRSSLRLRESHFIQLIVYDVSERMLRERKMRYEADHDPLTQLKNRRAGEAGLQNLLQATLEDNSIFVLMMIDLDRFKPVNDTYGHDIGDQVLKRVASMIKYYFNNECDLCVRWGGDEFVVGFRNDEFRENDIRTLAQNLLNDLSNPITLEDGTTCHIGGSIGIVVAPSDAEEFSDLIRKADDAMYTVKQRGRNQVCFVSELINT